MKTKAQIYNDLRDRFFKKTKLDVKQNGVFDSFFYAVSETNEDAYKEIEKNKTPHIWTSIKGKDIDSTGYMLNIPREANEKDDSYLFRIMNWTKINESSNSIAIEAALINIPHVSNATYIPYTSGVGTGTVYIIPKTIEESEVAIDATKEKLKPIVSPSSHIDYIIPELLPVKLVVYLSCNGDMDYIKNRLKESIQKYINSIAPGNYLEIGAIEKMGLNEPGVKYFRVAQCYIGDRAMTDIRELQKLESKFLLQDSDLSWLMAVK